MTMDWLYLVPIIPLVALELYAAFGRDPRWHTITDITRHWERRRWVYRFVLACLIGLEFTHLVLFWP